MHYNATIHESCKPLLITQLMTVFYIDVGFRWGYTKKYRYIYIFQQNGNTMLKAVKASRFEINFPFTYSPLSEPFVRLSQKHPLVILITLMSPIFFSSFAFVTFKWLRFASILKCTSNYYWSLKIIMISLFMIQCS